MCCLYRNCRVSEFIKLQLRDIEFIEEIREVPLLSSVLRRLKVPKNAIEYVGVNNIVQFFLILCEISIVCIVSCFSIENMRGDYFIPHNCSIPWMQDNLDCLCTIWASKKWYRKMGWLRPIFGTFQDLLPHCSHSTIWHSEYVANSTVSSLS